MFGHIRNTIFVGTRTFTGVNSLSCISMNNQEYKVRPEIVNVDSDELVFYLFSIKTSKCSGNCNNINVP